jgi:hypothetical protein
MGGGCEALGFAALLDALLCPCKVLALGDGPQPPRRQENKKQKRTVS